MTSNWVIETRGLRMGYASGEDVLRDVNLRVPRGAVYGLLGRNGCGKTTLIRLLMGLYRPTDGMIQVLGSLAPPLSLDARRRIGYLSQDQRMFGWMTLTDLIGFTRPFYPGWDSSYADRLIAGLDLPRHAPLVALSRGEQQKVGLLLALAPRPELLVLDEPAANLDTVLRREFLESVLGLLAEEGMTVLISSHILTDLERVADRIGILANGRIELEGELDQLHESVKRLRVCFDDEAPAFIDVPGAVGLRRRGRELLVTVRDYTDAVADEVRRRYGATVEVQDIDLEDLFIEFVR